MVYPFAKTYLGRLLAIATALATSVAAGGCGHASLTPLPELADLPIETIDAQQKQAAIKEMAEMRAKHADLAIDAIEKAR